LFDKGKQIDYIESNRVNGRGEPTADEKLILFFETAN
jgi:hypothetical protein